MRLFAYFTEMQKYNKNQIIMRKNYIRKNYKDKSSQVFHPINRVD